MKTRTRIAIALTLAGTAGGVDAQTHTSTAARSAEPRTSILSQDSPLAAATAPPPSFAPPRESRRRGFYLKGFGGLGLLEDEELIYDDGGGTVRDGDGSFDGGFLAGAAIGYRLSNHWRLEAEYTYRTNDVDSFESGGTTLADGGDYASTSLLLNVLYDFDTDWRLDPYVGVGFGTATEIDIDLEGPTFPQEQSFSGESPAAQFMIGGRGRWTDSLDYFVEGRFYRAFDPDLGGEGNAGNVESEYGHTSLLFGVSWGL